MADTNNNTAKLKEITLPLLEDDNAPTEQFVGFNCKPYRIQRGVPVKVPEPVYDILMDAERARMAEIRERRARALKAALKTD